MARPKSHGSPKDSSARLGFEAKLWLSADTALSDSAFLHAGGKLQVLTERQDNFRKDDDVRWQFGVPPKGNANFA